MKIPQEILLLCKNVRVYAPAYCTFNDIFGEDVYSKMFKCVGAKGRWMPIKRAFIVDAILHPYFSWQRIFSRSTSSNGAFSYKLREDAVALEDGIYEELLMKLELAGNKNVFEIPQKVVKMLEDASVKEVEYNAANFFMLSFKQLKEKCKKIC